MRTPRSLVLGLAAALVWFAPVLDTSNGEAPQAVTGTLEVTEWNGATARRDATPDPWTTSSPMPAGDTVLVGADWGGDQDVVVEVRSRRAGSWGPWQPFDGHAEHAPDPDTDEGQRAAPAAALSEPVWVGKSEELQFRSSEPLANLDVSTVAMVGGDGLGWTPDTTTGGAASAATLQPAIRSRASWGADESLRNDDPNIHQDVRFSIIHHVGGGNWAPGSIENGCAEADDWIRSIYAYHTNSRSYDDIAYNFVVDPCGTIWEGRGGGIEKAVQGAHASGFNSGSVGVLALGTFTSGAADPVTPELVDGIQRLLAWKLDLHHVDPDGTTTEIAGGGGSSRYRDGELVTLPVISAHQVQNSTSCPGGDLMAALFDGVLQSATPKEEIVTDVRRQGLPKAFGGPSATWSPGDNQDGNDRNAPLDDERPVWDVSFSRPLDWRLEITDKAGDVVRSTGGAAEARADRVWDLRNANGEPVAAGTYTATLTGVDDDGDEISPVVTELNVRSAIGRVAGDTRVSTAVELSQKAFDEASEVVLASSQAYPDALVASPLAASVDAPVLLTPKGALDPGVAAEIERLGATSVRVVGGTVAVSSEVTRALTQELGVDVIRHAGRTRYETAAIVAEVVTGLEGSDELLVALGNHPDPSRAFPDALAAGAFGSLVGSPVLLVQPGKLPVETREVLVRLAPSAVQLFGGTLAIDARVERAVERAAGLTAAGRFAGEDRFATAALAAEEALARRPGAVEPTTPGTASRASDAPSDDPTDDEADTRRPRTILIASGRNWPDALGAGAATAALGGLFVLVDDDDLDQSAATSSFLEDIADVVSGLLITGGPVAISSEVVLALEKLDLGGDIEAGDPIAWPADPKGPEPASSSNTSAPATATPTATSSPAGDESTSPSPSSSASPEPEPTATQTESTPDDSPSGS